MSRRHRDRASELDRAAANALPVAQRSRYHEEFLGEMIELPSRERCGYTLRILASSWKLRRELVKAPRQAKR